MQLIHLLIGRSRRTLVLAIVFGLLSGALNSGMLALVNAVISNHDAFERRLFVAFLALCAAAPLTRVVSELLLVRLGQDSILSLRTELSQQVLSVPLRNLEEMGPHRILSVLTDDVPNVTNMVAVIPILCINIGVVLSCVAYMGWLDWRLLMAVLVVMAAGIATYQFSVSRAAQHFHRAREHDNNLQKHFQALIHGMKELKLHQRRREAFVRTMLGDTARAARGENVAGLTTYAIASSWGQLLAFFIIGLVVFFLAHALGAQSAAFTGFALALLYLVNPLQVIMNAVPQLGRANVAVQNVEELGLTVRRESTQDENAEFVDSPRTAAELELSRVTYTYRREDSPNEFTLGPIDLTIRPAELLFITGGNGSGKTTLGKLITGLYSPESGEILYDEQQVTDDSRDRFRQCFSAVFSDFFLFESLLGLDGSHLDDRAGAYLSSLRLEHKVKVRDGMLSTTELSQGQRKRLALLTACLEDRPIYFFDEWAADQDPVFKEVFYFSILPDLKARGKTVIVITHDERFYDMAERIVHLESGKITVRKPGQPLTQSINADFSVR